MRKKAVYFIWIVVLAASFLFDKLFIDLVLKVRGSFLNTVFGWTIYLHDTLVIFFVVLALGNLFLILEKRKDLSVRFSIFLVLVGIVILALKQIFGRARPDIALADSLTNSFPSGHTAIFFAPLKFLVKYRYIWLVLAVFIALSRLYLGIHFLSDVVAGALLGYSARDVSSLIERKLLK